MTVLALASIKGSPGVTTAALAFAAAWPENRHPVLCDLDPAGADVTPVLRLAPEPSWLTLAAAARRSLSPMTILRHCHELTGGVRILAGPPPGERAQAAFEMLEPRTVVSALDQLVDFDPLVDLGRLDVANLAWRSVGTTAALTVIVVRPELAPLHHLAVRSERIFDISKHLGLVVVQPPSRGDGHYSSDEVADVLGIPLLGALPWDAKGAAALAGRGRVSQRALTRLPLLRAARSCLEAALTAAASVGTEPTPAVAVATPVGATQQ